MTALRTILVVLALLLLGAHLSRAGVPLVFALGVTTAALCLLFVRSHWAATAVRAVLALGALEWLRALVVYSRQRAAVGEPWIRLAVILAAVASLTALAAWLHRPRVAANESGASD